LAYKNASSTYKETTIITAGQGQLIVMLYDEAAKQLTKAINLLEEDSKQQKKDPSRIEQINKAVMKTEEILTELMVSLDFEQGGEISKNLFSLYTWFNRELIEANITKDTGRLSTVKNLLCELRDSWSKIASQNTVDHTNREAVGLNIAG